MTQQPNAALDFRVEPGQWDDYLRLAQHHYRSRRPATVCQVWRLAATWNDEHRVDSPTLPAVSSGEANAPLLWLLGGYPKLAGVLVLSYPVLCSAARNRATAGRYCTQPRAVGIARLNREVRTISRVIVHPQYRGLGLATRFVADVLARAHVAYIEAFARMGRFVPFFRNAGMAEFPPARPDGPVYYLFGREKGSRAICREEKGSRAICAKHPLGRSGK